jgi:hypothetical protein
MGLPLAQVAAARRTQSSFPTFFSRTNPSDLTLPTAAYGVTGNAGYNAANVHEISRLPLIKHVASVAQLNNALVHADGSEIVPVNPPPNLAVHTEGSVDGAGFDQDRITITRGRMADPRRADEMVIDRATPVCIVIVDIASALIESLRPRKTALAEQGTV